MLYRIDKFGLTLFSKILNFYTFIYCITGIFIFIENIFYFICYLYLFPPLLCRLTILIFGKPIGKNINQHNKEYKIWWFLHQVQTIFNRFPFLEEILKLIPAIYPLWLNLWGSKVHTMTYWGPRIIVLDRYLLEIGGGTVLGTRTLYSGHMGFIKDNEHLITVDKLVIGEKVIIGVDCIIGPGCVIHNSQQLNGNTKLQPYTEFKDGKKMKGLKNE